MKSIALLPCVAALSYAFMATVACAQSERHNVVWISGTVKSFDCGDNCYLTIIKDKFNQGQEETGLCFAKVCYAWWSKMEMPRSFIGKSVRVRLGVGWITDAENEKQGYTISFEELIFQR